MEQKIFNYINEGVIRTAGLTKKCMEKKAEDITLKEIKTITNLTDFLGEESLDMIDKEHNIEYHIKYGTQKKDNKKTEKIFRKFPIKTESDLIQMPQLSI